MRAKFLKWHRWLSLVLIVQLAIWLTTAAGMALIPAKSLSAYPQLTPGEFGASGAWPATAELRAAAPTASRISLEQTRAGPLLAVQTDGETLPELFNPSTLLGHSEISEDDVRAIASEITGEDLSSAEVTAKEGFSPEYTYSPNNVDRPLPAWRIDAEKATLFFDPRNGELVAQATDAQRLENIFKSLHTMDYTLSVNYKDSTLLTFFAAVFLATAILGILPLRRVYALKGQGWKSIRWHQALGIVLFIQVIFWATSGFSVIWMIDRFKADAENVEVRRDSPIDWEQVAISPTEIFAQSDRAPSKIDLTMLLGEPVYQAKWFPAGAPRMFFEQVDDSGVYSAVDGRKIELTDEQLERITREAVGEKVAASFGEWSEQAVPTEDFFYGPFPVRKAIIGYPSEGAVVIDPATGYVHSPVRLRKQVWLAEYYKLHVVYPFPGVLKYRFEPLLLIVIGATLLLLIFGSAIHLRRWRMKRRKAKG